MIHPSDRTAMELVVGGIVLPIAVSLVALSSLRQIQSVRLYDLGLLVGGA